MVRRIGKKKVYSMKINAYWNMKINFFTKVIFIHGLRLQPAAGKK